MNLFMPGIGSMLSIGIDIFSAYLDVKTAGEDDINTAKMDLLKEMGAAAWSSVEPYVRYIPFVGSLWLAKDAYDAFNRGDYGNTLVYLLRGVANWVPLAGTAVNLGLGVMQAMLSEDNKVEGDAIQAGALDLVAEFGPVIEEWVGGFIRDVPFVGSFFHAKDMVEYFNSNDYARGFLSLGAVILNLVPGMGMVLGPAFGFLRGMFDPEYRMKTKSADLGGQAMDWMEGVYETVKNWFFGFIHDMIDEVVPDVFGLQDTIRDKLIDWGIKRPSNNPGQSKPKPTYTTKTGTKRRLLTPEMMGHLNDETLAALINNQEADLSSQEIANAKAEQDKRQTGRFYSMRADGGPVSADSTYLVGERGPEFFQPTQDGQVHSNESIVELLNSQNNILEKLSENILTAIEETGTVVNNTSMASNSNSTSSDNSVQSFRENVRARWFT